VSPHPEELVSSDELLDICRHLIVLNDVSNSFELAHLSVREYLETHEEYRDGQPHALAAERCIKLFEPDIPRGLCHEYASLYWPDHYNHSPQTGEDALTDVVKEFFRDKGVNPAFENWAELVKDFSNSLSWGENLARRLRDSGYKPLSVVSVFGFPKVLGQWVDPAPESSYFQHPDFVVHLAIKWGNAEVVQLLLQSDSQPTVDNVGWTSLVWAAAYEQKPVLDVLKVLYRGVDAKDEMGWTALHWMVFIGHIEGSKVLLSARAGPGMTDKAKWTPMHWAAFLDRDIEIKELLGEGHRLDAEDRDGLTPLQWARFVGHQVTARLLQKNEAVDGFSSNLSASAGDKLVRMDW
jgi:hypothetical protein